LFAARHKKSKENLFFKKNKGAVLLWAMIISVIALAIGLAISLIALTETRVAGDLANSDKAYRNAETALEKALQMHNAGTLSNGYEENNCQESSCYYFKNDNGQLIAKGSFNGGVREIKINLP